MDIKKIIQKGLMFLIIGLSAVALPAGAITLWYLDGNTLRPVDSGWTIDVDNTVTNLDVNAGSLIYGDSAGKGTQLASSTDGKVLKINSIGYPAWETGIATTTSNTWGGTQTFTNNIAGSITGNAGTVSTIAGLAPDTATTQATQPNITTLLGLTNATTTQLTSTTSWIGTILSGIWNGTKIDISDYTNLAVTAPVVLTGDTLSVSASSDTATGIVELATIAETNTGTDATRTITPDGLAGSIFGEKNVDTILIAGGTAIATGTSTYERIMPATVNGMNIVEAICGTDEVATSTVRLVRNRAGVEAYVFSTDITITQERYASDEVIDTANDDLNTGDILYWVILSATDNTAKGLSCGFTAKKP